MKFIIILISSMLLATSSFAGDLSEQEVLTFLKEWLSAQNSGSYSNYATMYSNSFTGIKRSGSSMSKLNHDAWLKDRKKMFNKKMVVEANNLEVNVSGTTATIKFEQTWESGTYKDKGSKLLNLATENGKLKIIREDMLFSEVVTQKYKAKISSDSTNIITFKEKTDSLEPDYISKFTSIESKNCSKLPKQIDTYFEKHGLYGDECKAPKGWRLFIVVGGDRSWVDIAHSNSLWTTEQEVMYKNDNFFGYFPNITSKQVEWRINKNGIPSALIFRITAQNPEQVGTNESRLFVVSLKDGIPQFCGTAKTNEEARSIADNTASCSTTLPKRPIKITTK